MSNVHLEVKERIACVTIDHPPANALNRATLEELEQVLDRVEKDSDIKVAVVTGEGKFFVAGADIKEFLQVNRDEGDGLARLGQRVFNRIENLKKPVIAAINGACLGGGLELALACHIRIAASDAKLGLPELNLGLIPGYGGTQRLPRVIGKEKATELILASRMIDGEEAFQTGLVSKVVPLESLMDEVQSLARTIASKSAVSLQLALEAINDGLNAPLEKGLELEAENFGKAFASEDMLEGVQAFLDKRSPQFKDK
ncbi:MAG: enoyl-CoA hydratase [Bacillaceae bacterium]|nr:enoyl-CoA hydratase [Bacillaceae bacterium]